MLAYLVENFRFRLERHEAVGEADRHQNLVPFLRREFESDPFREGRRTLANVDHDIEHPASNNANELRLRLGRKLIVQAAQRARSRGIGMVVLYEDRRDAVGGEGLRIVGLRKEAALVAESARNDFQNPVEAQGPDFKHPRAP